MSTAKLTIKRGQHVKDVVISAGTAITGSDAMELNIDVTNMTQGDAVMLVEQLEMFVEQHDFPLS